MSENSEESNQNSADDDDDESNSSNDNTVGISVTSSVKQAEKDKELDKDIQLLRDIGQYMQRTSRRITKKIVKEIEEKNKIIVTKENSAQTLPPAATIEVIPESQAPPARSLAPPNLANSLYNGGIPSSQNKNFNLDLSLAHYEHMSESERTKLVNDAISLLLNDSSAERNRPSYI